MEEWLLSVIIPARNEIYLAKTIDSVLAAAEGKTEVIAICDGYCPDPPIKEDPRVTVLSYAESIGQRAAVNAGAAIAKGKFIMKTDGHSMFDQGFDVKLAADCEYDWTVIPRMYNLDVEKWEPKWNKKTDYMWIRSPDEKDKPLRSYYWDSRTAKEYPEEYREYRKRIKGSPDIDDVMTGQGACFFMHKKRFWELGGMDEGHGSWGGMGIEVAMKAWLSGGRHVVNKKTWFAHWFRTGSIGFPYPISGSDQERARKYSRDLWVNGKWDKAVRSLDWMADKFNPPGWKVPITAPKGEINIAMNKSKLFRQHSHIKNHTFKMSEIIPNMLEFRDTRRPLERAKRRLESQPPFIKKILAGEEFTDEQLMQQDYYEALRSTQKTSHKKSIRLMRDLINVARDIQKNGVRNPIDLWKHKGKLVIHRGWRRILIMNELGYTKVPCRIFKNREYFLQLAPYRFHKPDDTINGLAMQQYMKLEDKSTDKYWVHQYTPLYDNHIGYLKKEKIKLLEIGLLRGASLALWDSFFSNAEIFGIDITERWKELTPKTCTVFQGRQEDVEFLNKEVIPNGKYDIIIDDCGHKPGQTIQSFKAMWDSLNEKGWYIVEDLYGNYKGNRLKGSTVNMLKDLIDEMNTKCSIKSMHFYYNICFIQKGAIVN